jgi:anthranilate synthase component 2
MLLVLDNRDSFTFNLVQLLLELGARLEVRRSDAVGVAEVRALAPRHILVGPGPGGPQGAGCSEALIRELSGSIPVLGVCLGHQAIATAFGGRVAGARELVHGWTSRVAHDGRGVFAGLPQHVACARYHSLAVVDDGLPACLEVSARAEDGTIMGLRHRERPVEGVQFHPESVLSRHGRELLANFLAFRPNRAGS